MVLERSLSLVRLPVRPPSCCGQKEHVLVDNDDFHWQSQYDVSDIPMPDAPLAGEPSGTAV